MIGYGSRGKIRFSEVCQVAWGRRSQIVQSFVDNSEWDDLDVQEQDDYNEVAGMHLNRFG